MNELSLFSGAGGGLLATHHLLGWRSVGYVEWDNYCQRVLRHRIDDGLLDDAPIFGDIRAFNDQYARRYRGLVDVVSGGDPCQANSAAVTSPSKQPCMAEELLECVRIIEPRWVFRENPMPRQDAEGSWWRVEDGLRSIGYSPRTLFVKSCCFGLDHRRPRVFTVGCRSDIDGEPIIQADPLVESFRKKETRETWKGTARVFGRDESRPLRMVLDTDVCRKANDVPYRVDRIKSVGNSQSPIVAATAWRLLTEEYS